MTNFTYTRYLLQYYHYLRAICCALTALDLTTVGTVDAPYNGSVEDNNYKITWLDSDVTEVGDKCPTGLFGR